MHPETYELPEESIEQDPYIQRLHEALGHWEHPPDHLLGRKAEMADVFMALIDDEHCPVTLEEFVPDDETRAKILRDAEKANSEAA